MLLTKPLPIAKRNHMSATQTKSTATIENVADRVAELNEKTLESGKKVTATYLDSYEKAIAQLAAGFEKAADATKIEWLSTAAPTQADLTREAATAYVSAARELVAR
jgi:hypothetical protein